MEWIDTIATVLTHFSLTQIRNIEQIKSGNINTTYLVECGTNQNASTRRYILQKINVNVFKNPIQVMENIEKTTTHLKEKLIETYGSYERRCVIMRKAKSGKSYVNDENLGFWRCMEFVEDAIAYDKVEELGHFESAGAAFGEFQCMLDDFDATTLFETIPNFHNTKIRYENFLKDVALDAAKRVQSVQTEITAITKREALSHFVVDLMQEGKIPVRVTHNDTKLNNIMIDRNTGEGICVIDLDTIMPGTALFDFGDAIRFGANHTIEDDPNLEEVYLDLQLFEAFAKGFITKTKGFLTEEEIRLLPIGALVITYEQALRFLDDYINGDTYFKTLYETHNLVRARNQIKLLEDMQEKLPMMQAIVQQFA